MEFIFLALWYETQMERITEGHLFSFGHIVSSRRIKKVTQHVEGSWETQEWRPAIALFSINRKLIRPKGFYSAEQELRVAVWRQTHSSELKDQNQVWTKTTESVRTISFRVYFCSQEGGNTCINVNPCLIWTPLRAGNMWNKWFTAQQLSKCVSMFSPKTCSDFQPQEESVQMSADSLLSDPKSVSSVQQQI